MTEPTLTIGRLARAAAVNIETVRYYQARKLLPIPIPDRNTFRQYPAALVERIRFIKRAQELDFSLDEIRGLLRLHDGTDRVSYTEDRDRSAEYQAPTGAKTCPSSE